MAAAEFFGSEANDSQCVIGPQWSYPTLLGPPSANKLLIGSLSAPSRADSYFQTPILRLSRIAMVLLQKWSKLITEPCFQAASTVRNITALGLSLVH